MKFARSMCTAVLAMTLAGSAAIADTVQAEQGALSPGKPAGVQQAQIYGTTVLWLGLGAAAIAGIILINGDNKNTTATSTNP